MNKTEKKLFIILTTALVAAIAILYLFLFLNASANEQKLRDIASQPSHWDMTALDDWCGQPEGAVRVIGAFKVDDNTLETEDGHQWNFENVTFDDGLYIMWIDNNNTPDDVTDDLPIHIWKEVMF